MATETFVQELAAVINRHSRENRSNTPDFLLAAYLEGCLTVFEEAIRDRETWYGRPFVMLAAGDGTVTAPDPPPPEV